MRPSTVPNATDSTDFLCPVKGSPICLPVVGSHNRTVLSSLPEASTVRPSTVPNATDSTDFLCPVKGSPICLPVVGSHNRTVSSQLPEASTVRPSTTPNATDSTPGSAVSDPRTSDGRLPHNRTSGTAQRTRPIDASTRRTDTNP